jgi:DNA-binding beta-propeller fold protein YncE
MKVVGSPVVQRRVKFVALVLSCAATSAPWPARADSPPPYLAQWTTGSSPSGIAVSQTSGDVYVSDGANRVTRYNAGGGLIATYSVGTTSARGLAADETSNLFVADFGGNSLLRLTLSGTLISSWTVTAPTGVAAAGGFVYVLSGDAVIKYTTAGGLVTSWGTTGSGAGQFNGPRGVSVDIGGNVYVTDTGNHRIQKFTTSGTYVTQWGSSGSGDGQFSSPQGVTADRFGHVIVADTGNNRLQAFTYSGSFLSKWGTLGGGNAQFDTPNGVATSFSGLVYALDGGNKRVQEFGFVTTASLSSSVNPSVFGQNTQLTAALAPSAPGTVTIYDGAVALGSGSGGVVLNVSTLNAGSHSLTAQYPGDATHSACVSPVVTQTVNPATTTTAIAVDVNPSGSSQFITFIATVSVVAPGAGTPTGTVTFYDGATTLGTATVSGGIAGLFSSSLSVGSHSITASYSGTPNYAASTSSPLSQIVIPPGTAPVFLTTWGSFGTSPGQFNQPHGVALAPNGDLYVVDSGNSRVEYFKSGGSSLNGTWGTNGSGAGQFNNPSGIAIDGSSSVYVADTGNQRIQKFTAIGTYVSQWGTAGNGNGQFMSPAGVAVSPTGGVYVVDSGNRRIQVFTTGGVYVSQWGTSGAGDGQFSSPSGIAVAPGSGDVYVVDSGNARIQRFTSTGVFLGKWGSAGGGNGQFGSPWGVAVEASGNVYVAEVGVSRVQKFNSGGAYLAKWGTSGTGNGQFEGAFGVVVNGAGTVTVSDLLNSRVQKFGTPTSTFMSTGTNPSVFGQSVNLQALVSPSAATGTVTFYDGATPLISAGLSGGTATTPYSDLAVGTHSLTAHYEGGPDHAASVSAPITQVVNKATPAFALSTDPSPSGLGQPVTIGVTMSGAPPGAGVPSGNVSFLDGATMLGSAALSGGTASLTAPLAANAGPHSITVSYAGDGSFLSGTSAAFGHTVLSLDHPGLFVSQWGSAGSGNGQFSSPFDVAVDPARNVFVADRGNHRIEKFSAAGAFLTKWGSQGSLGNGQFQNPSGVAVDAAGAVYVCDTGNHRIQKFSNNGSYLLQWGSQGSGDGSFQSPADLAVDPDGNVLVCDTGNQRIQKFSGTGTYLAQWGTAGSGNGEFQSPGAIAADAAGNVYVCDTGNHRIQEFTIDGLYVRQWGSNGTAPGQFEFPAGIAVEAAGNVYVADAGNNRIQKFGPGAAFLVQWGTAGSAAGELSSPQGMAVDGQGYLLVADSGNQRIQRFRRPAWITAVADVPGDQGHQVRIRFLADALDIAAAAAPIVRYDVFRKIDESLSARAARDAGPARTRPPGTLVAGWDYVGTHPAFADSEYNLVVPTLADSNGSGPHTAVFFVRAATATPSVYFDSRADSGRSRDNLPPAIPAPFAGVYSGGASHLHWGLNTEADFWYYRLYKGSTIDFVPGPGTLIASTADTGYVDPDAAGGCYKLTAVDSNDNSSPYATVSVSGTVGVPAESPLAFTLDEVRPNPVVRGRLTARFILPSDAPATLELVDVTGRRIVARDVGALGPGRHAVDLLEVAGVRSGIYFIRLRQGDALKTVRTAVLQ